MLFRSEFRGKKADRKSSLCCVIHEISGREDDPVKIFSLLKLNTSFIGVQGPAVASDKCELIEITVLNRGEMGIIERVGSFSAIVKTLLSDQVGFPLEPLREGLSGLGAEKIKFKRRRELKILPQDLQAVTVFAR